MQLIGIAVPARRASSASALSVIAFFDVNEPAFERDR
jgi:hypothetical protein